MRRHQATERNSEQQILDYFSSHAGTSFSARELARRLHVKKKDFKIFRRSLLDMARNNRIRQVDDGMFQAATIAGRKGRRGTGHRQPAEHHVPQQRQQSGPRKFAMPAAGGRKAPAQPLIEGVLQQYRGGFAFVLPTEKDQEDIFVPPGGLGGAIHGDRVLVRIVRSQGHRKAEGQVAKVLERKTKTLVGTFLMSASYGRVIPWDKKVQIQPIVSTKNFGGATDGMMVEAEIVTDGANPEARIISLLGFPGEPDLDAKIIITKYGLPRAFPAEITEEAAQVGVIREEDYKGRKDFRDWYTVTIDGEKARDFDDAISLTTFKNGNYLLGVHIADVAHYVTDSTPLDLEARERGNSVYFPDLVIPMLPEKLSNEICSLNPQVDRMTISVVARMDSTGRLLEYHIHPSVINSNERMTYTAMKKIVEDQDREMMARYEPLLDMFFSMRKLALLLMDQRRGRGSIDFDLPEPEVILDLTTGRMTGVIKSERNIAHRMIEEFMLLANEIVAGHIEKSGLPGMYRVHENPPAEKIMDFSAIAASLGYRLPSAPEKIKPMDLQKLLERAAGKPEERFLNVLLLRAMARARYDVQNSGHFGLALENYTHFTSPIRRYPDLIVHRVLRALFSAGKAEGKKLQKMRPLFAEIAEHCSVTERRADDAEREFIQLKKIEFMRDKLGDVFDGFITGVASFGLFVELKDYFVEGLVPMKFLDDDHYVYHENRHYYKGRRTGRVYRLGDPVHVQVVRVDRDRREIDFVLA